MLKKSLGLAFFLLVSLSGCAYMTGEHYSQQTIQAINQSEEKLSNRIEELDSNLDKQTDYIASLEAEVINLSNEVELMKRRQQRYLSSAHKTQTPSQPSGTSNIVVTDLEPQTRPGMVTLGSLEKVDIDIVKTSFTARVDTGATTSSINAIDLQEFERNGKKWVKFHIADNRAPEDRLWIEAPIIKHVKIRQSSTNALDRRPVVEIWIKIGSIHEKAQFTLADRTQMDYPILLGREFIQDVAYVDVSREFIESKEPPKKISTQ
ncbi:ATP-dependent zinc protease family protein [Vibrio aphrogenes]|uniref:ATP-dependent zinc protease family protein n=1 Tax=Vibrio aphrogenes TaxID=1891186 RepID=UPI000B34BB9A|nr:ATP-dependent zinc protease [Vibrio aphrogenes]